MSACIKFLLAIIKTVWRARESECEEEWGVRVRV